MSDDKPREYWIAQGSHADIVCYNEKQATELQWIKQPIHVIEYAAYEQALEKIRQLEGRLQITNSNWPHEKALHKKIAELEAENNKLTQLFSVQLDMLEKIKTLTAQNEVMRVALKVCALGETQFDGVEAMHSARKALARCKELEKV